MPLLRFLMRCDPRAVGQCVAAERPEPTGGGLVVDIRPLLGPLDLAAAVELAGQSRTGDGTPAGRLSPSGLRAELTSREGRRVHGWLAWPVVREPSVTPQAPDPASGMPPAADAVSSGDRCPLGMVTVVDVGRPPLVRASIAWLLVHPAARRHGVATALVRRARAEVGRLGGEFVSAETLSSWPAATAFWTRVAGDEAFEPLRSGGGSMMSG